MKTYKVRIKGVRPLLFNRYPLDIKTAGQKVKKDSVFNAEENAKRCLYVTTDGLIHLPAEHLEGALIKGATQIKFKGKKTFKDIVATSVIVMPREVPFSVPEDPSKYVVDVTTAVVPATRGRIPVARPRWDAWEFEFEIRADADGDLDIDTLRSVLEEAGKVGVGTYRLKYGKFILESLTEVK